MSAPNGPAISNHKVRWTAVQQFAFLVAGVFGLVGILGFIPGVTTNYDMLAWAGHHSGAKLLGAFDVSVLHNLVHMGFGIAGAIIARTFNGARVFLVGGGLIYAVLFVYGVLIDRHSAANVIPVNSADNLLHLGLALMMLFLGWAFGRQGTDRPLGDLSTGVTVRKN